MNKPYSASLAILGVWSIACLALAAPAIEKPADKIIKTESGLQYVELKKGEGTAAKAGDSVQVHYTGTLKDGKQFDSTLDRKAPFAFDLGGGKVIKGFDEGVTGMKIGGKRKVIIPPELGYGKTGAGNIIPPDAELIFEIELLTIN
jgi:FKBP-type peptidyl-prolyl cis-trans isomerase